MKKQERYFFEPQSLTGRKKQTADTVFETKVLRTLRDVCLPFDHF